MQPMGGLKLLIFFFFSILHKIFIKNFKKLPKFEKKNFFKIIQKLFLIFRNFFKLTLKF